MALLLLLYHSLPEREVVHEKPNQLKEFLTAPKLLQLLLLHHNLLELRLQQLSRNRQHQCLLSEVALEK